MRQHRQNCMPVSVDPKYSVAGFLVGLLVGQTGMGGGALMTPVLILLFGVHPATAVGIDLLYASMTKTIGTLVHGLSRTVKWRIVGLLASGSVPATALTLLLISRFDITGSTASGVISNLLGGMLLLTALSLVFRRQFLEFAGTRLVTVTPRRTAQFTVLTGAMLGVLVTISSVGAGVNAGGKMHWRAGVIMHQGRAGGGPRKGASGRTEMEVCLRVSVRGVEALGSEMVSPGQTLWADRLPGDRSGRAHRPLAARQR